MLFSIIIPTFNRVDLLEKCLGTFAPGYQSMDIESYEVIVTNDGDYTPALKALQKKHPWVQHVSGPRKGPAANRNNGAGYAAGEWLLFIDDDCIPDPNLLMEYFEAIQHHPSVHVFEGAIIVDRGKKSFLEESPINEEGNRLWSCNFMIKKDFFLETLNGFDEGFPYPAIEDVELHHRILNKKEPVKFVRSAFVVHPWRKQKRLARITLQRFYSTQYFLTKHPEQRSRINSRYYLNAFYHSFFKDTLKNLFKYRWNGVFQKLQYDVLQLYFAFKVFKKS